MRTITVTNFKGGSGKTTSTAFLAHAFAELGRSVLIVDADPQGSLLRWATQGDWEIPALGLPVKNLHRKLPGIVGQRYDVVLIDTPPLDEESGIVYSAMRAADQIIIAMAPTMMELERVQDVTRAVEETEALRDGPVDVRVLLNRTISNASSTGVVRGAIAKTGVRVLDTTIPRREAIAQSFGAPITGPLHGYISAAEELAQEVRA